MTKKTTKKTTIDEEVAHATGMEDGAVSTDVEADPTESQVWNSIWSYWASFSFLGFSTTFCMASMFAFMSLGSIGAAFSVFSIVRGERIKAPAATGLNKH